MEETGSVETRGFGETVERIASFYQSDTLAAVATLRANVIKTELFKRLRNLTQVREGRTVTGFQIVEMQGASERRFRETIKNFTFLNTRREVV